MHYAFKTSLGEVSLHWRTGGSLFDLTRLKAKIKSTIIRDLPFTDGAALVAHSETTLQKMMDLFSQACKKFSLMIKVKKLSSVAK